MKAIIYYILTCEEIASELIIVYIQKQQQLFSSKQ